MNDLPNTPHDPGPPYERLLDIEEVADWLGVSVRSVEDLVARKKIVPARVLPRRRRFSPEQVRRYIASVTK
jgi:excisionase family DNA binding protein